MEFFFYYLMTLCCLQKWFPVSDKLWYCHSFEHPPLGCNSGIFACYDTLLKIDFQEIDFSGVIYARTRDIGTNNNQTSYLAFLFYYW